MLYRLRYASACALVVPLVAFGGHREPRVSALDRGPLDEQDLDGRAAGPEAREDVAEDEDEEDGDEADPDVGGADETAAMLGKVDAGRHEARRGGCPKNMVRAREFCVDRFEAPNRRGARPLVMQSAKDAEAWCSERTKRLCTEDEWMAACEGDERRPYPYGSEHVEGRCNDDKPWQKVDEARLAKWPAASAKEEAKALYQATPSGSKRKCVSSAGAHDMTGNVEEWVVRTREHSNPWPYILVGCYWSGCYGGGKPTCHSTNDAHGPDFRFYETGFRCCKDSGKTKL